MKSNPIIRGRNSNVEMLRLVSMFMILILHADYYSLGFPKYADFVASPVPTFFRSFFESVSLVSVNLFVLISGWYGIKFKGAGLVKLIFQSVFIIGLVYSIGIALGFAEFSADGILQCFLTTNGAWFVRAYIGLWIFSPILNKFVEDADKRTFTLVLASFYVFQTLYGFYPYRANFIADGYSTFSFVGLYLLAQYVRKYQPGIYERPEAWLMASLAIYVVGNFLITIYATDLEIVDLSILYTNPLCVLVALSMLLVTVKMEPTFSRVVNYIASSAFVVYLIHICNHWTAAEYKRMALQIYNEYSGLEYLGMIALFLLAVFAAGILLDQIRKLFWAPIQKRL